MKKLKLYLAHNLYTRKMIREVELYFEKTYNVELVNPFYDRTRKHIKKIDKGKCSRWGFSRNECLDIVLNDCRMIDSCVGIVAVISENSQHIGTILEIAYAYHHKQIIYIISNRFYNHPWLKIYATRRFKTFEDFEKWLIKMGYEK